MHTAPLPVTTMPATRTVRRKPAAVKPVRRGAVVRSAKTNRKLTEFAIFVKTNYSAVAHMAPELRMKKLAVLYHASKR